ncbi:hypothetical protein [Micromonospora sp. NBC_00617]|uniref:hypothetical protein n=1 Tax=Micromonospora sp. NBC_00617 TaxID=2903587 RepID=UPI0030E3C69E
MDVLIELGDTRGAPPTHRRAPRAPSRRWRVALLLAACALLGGAAAPAHLSTRVGPPVSGHATLLGAGPLLLVVDPPTLSAYDVAAPYRAPRWRVAVPPAAGWSAEAAGDVLLLTERDQARQAVATTARSMRTGEALWRRPERVYAVGEAAVAGYDLPGLAPRWEMPVQPGELTLRACQGLVCAQDEHGRRALDPASGVVRWTWPAGARWHTVAGTRAATDALVLLQTAADGRRTLVATAGRDGPRVRGALPVGVSHCRRAGSGLACRESASRVTVWPLGAP